MAKKKWVVDLTEAERAELLALVTKGQASARRLRRAHILLLAAEDRPDEEVAAALHTNRSTVERTRRKFVEGGLAAALDEQPRPGAPSLLDGRARATLVALACTTPPDGRKCWTLQLLADALVARKVVPAISDETVRRTLKKTHSSPGSGSGGACRR